MNRPFTRDPYPRWYRRLPVNVLMPWRNLGCLGVTLGPLYMDAYRTWHFPWFGIYMHLHRVGRVYPIAELKRMWRQVMRRFK